MTVPRQSPRELISWHPTCSVSGEGHFDETF
jgi:hypothetical protein